MPWVDQPGSDRRGLWAGRPGISAGRRAVRRPRTAGRLAETFPVRQADVPSDQWFPGHPHQVEYREGLAVGYRAAETVPAPLFCFGHGLGYTTFEYGDVSLNRTRADPTSRYSSRFRSPTPGLGLAVTWSRCTCTTRPAPWSAAARTARLRQGPTGSRSDRAGRDRTAAACLRLLRRRQCRVAGPGGVHVIEVGASSQDIRTSTERRSPEPPRITRPESSLTARSDTAFAARLGRSIPIPRPDRLFTRLTTVGELRFVPLGRIVRSGLHRYTRVSSSRWPTATTSTAERLAGALDEMPLRAAVLFTDGTVPGRRSTDCSPC